MKNMSVCSAESTKNTVTNWPILLWTLKKALDFGVSMVSKEVCFRNPTFRLSNLLKEKKGSVN